MDWSVLPCSKLLSDGNTPDPLVIETCPHWPYKSITANTSDKKKDLYLLSTPHAV